MRAQEFIVEAEPTPAEQFIADVYTEYPQTFQNNHVMAFSKDEFAMFELKPSTSRRGAVEIYWFQAYPLRSGVGTRAIQLLQDKAREYGVGLTLIPWDKGQVSQAALTKFYKKQGFQPAVKGGRSLMWEPAKQVNEISDEQLQRYLDRAGRRVDARQERMAQARDRLNKGYEIYHADVPNKIVDRFEANTPAEAKRYYDRYIANYDSDVDYDLRLRRATGITEDAVKDLEKDLKQPHSYDAIDHMMQTIAREEGITAKELHDRFVDKHGMTPDDWIKDRLEEANGIIEGKYDANPATYNLPRRPLNVSELIKRGAIFVVDPHGDNGWEPNAEGFSLVTLYNVKRGGWPAEAKQHLKPSMYKVAAKALNQQGPGTMMYDGKYNQILWSIKKLGIPEEVAFLDTVAENFADGKVKGKSRPGRVKRSGASCKGSVTDLRAKARKYGGEKGKMYHWCANMKSGRKK